MLLPELYAFEYFSLFSEAVVAAPCQRQNNRTNYLLIEFAMASPMFPNQLALIFVFRGDF